MKSCRTKTLSSKSLKGSGDGYCLLFQYSGFSHVLENLGNWKMVDQFSSLGKHLENEKNKSSVQERLKLSWKVECPPPAF